jgi:hypothetical protein
MKALFASFGKWFRRPQKSVRPRVASPPSVTYHAELDSESDRELKARWVQAFRRQSEIRKAFFVSATQPGAAAPARTLAIVCETELDATLVEAIRKAGGDLLGPADDLHVMRLMWRDYGEIERVSTAFYFAV